MGALSLQFERAAAEFRRWRDVPECDRSPAPAWWWSSALAFRQSTVVLTPDQASAFGLPNGASAAQAADLMLSALADQVHQPWPDEFPRRYQWNKAEDATTA